MLKSSLKRISCQIREKRPLTKPSATAFLLGECCLSSKAMHLMSTGKSTDQTLATVKSKGQDTGPPRTGFTPGLDKLKQNKQQKDSQVVFPVIPAVWHVHTMLRLCSCVHGLNAFPFWKAAGHWTDITWLPHSMKLKEKSYFFFFFYLSVKEEEKNWKAFQNQITVTQDLFVAASRNKISRNSTRWHMTSYFIQKTQNSSKNNVTVLPVQSISASKSTWAF